MQDLEKIIPKFEKLVSRNFCNDLARKCKFVQRSTSQIKGFEFAQALLVPNAFIEAETLNSLAVRMHKINNDCNLSAPALAQRINSKGAESFMQACFETVLKAIMQQDLTGLSDLKNLSGFNRMLIEDSTRAELHEELSTEFKGSGGVASKASVKIDYIFDYLTEKIVDIDFFSGSKPDQSLAGRVIHLLEKDDLVIRDLGYFVIKNLLEIEEKGAYYVSRWKVNEDVYESPKATKPLDLAEFLAEHMREGIADVEVFVGKTKHPVRMVACLLSEEALNKRRRDANRSAQRHGTKISKKKTNLLKYCIFVTNVPASILTSNSIMAIYRARWRIEIIFKQWKSCLNFHIFKGGNLERFHCLLYGRLTMILLLSCLSPILMAYANRIGKELSCYKLTKYLVADHGLATAIQQGKLDIFIDKLIEDLPRRLCMDKRNRPSLRANVRMGNSYYNPLDLTGLYEKVA